MVRLLSEMLWSVCCLLHLQCCPIFAPSTLLLFVITRYFVCVISGLFSCLFFMPCCCFLCYFCSVLYVISPQLLSLLLLLYDFRIRALFVQYLTVARSVSTPVCLSVCQSVSFSLCSFLFVCMSVCLSVCLSVSVSVCLSVCLSVARSLSSYLSLPPPPLSLSNRQHPI